MNIARVVGTFLVLNTVGLIACSQSDSPDPHPNVSHLVGVWKSHGRREDLPISSEAKEKIRISSWNQYFVFSAPDENNLGKSFLFIMRDDEKAGTVSETPYEVLTSSNEGRIVVLRAVGAVKTLEFRIADPAGKKATFTSTIEGSEKKHAFSYEKVDIGHLRRLVNIVGEDVDFRWPE